MIKQILLEEEFCFDVLPQNCYSRILKYHYNAYGTKYDFCRFFKVEENETQALICLFNSSMIVVMLEQIDITDVFIKDILMFMRINKPERIETNELLFQHIKEEINNDYVIKERTKFIYSGNKKAQGIKINENPKLDDVFLIVKQAFPEMQSLYETWITDISHRIRHSQSAVYTYKNVSTLMVKYIIDGYAFIGQIGTLPQERGKHYARELIYYVCNKMNENGIKVCLFAKENLYSYYKEIGFIPILTDYILERKIINE